MARHSFIRMSKLPNVKGRIDYISSPDRQENLYATYRTADMEFWKNLAFESQQEFRRFGTEGKCIEARELIIALPEVYTTYDPQEVLKEFTEEFHKRYGVECVSALHHNKRKTNYHIHLIFSERTLLPEPDIKIASRSVFYDETGKRVRTKKEITGEDGKIRPGCTVIKKGEVYEQHMFTPKDERFKDKGFLHNLKEIYTDLINRHISDPAQQLRVFDPNGVYLATKKIGKNNPKAAEIEADNAARQEWNRTADMALLSGIAEETIIELKNEEIHNKAADSVTKHGWLPELFRKIVRTAKELLQGIIRSTQLPLKPTLQLDIAEFRHMQKLMAKAQAEAKAIRTLQDVELPKLQAQLADIKGIFKGKERKAVETQIQALEQEIRQRTDIPMYRHSQPPIKRRKQWSAGTTGSLPNGSRQYERRSGLPKDLPKGRVSGISFAGFKRKAGRNPGTETEITNGNFDNKKHTAQRKNFRWRCLHSKIFSRPEKNANYPMGVI